jgi:hypothetical protein
MLNKMKGHNMTNKCDSCGEETAYDEWSSYTNDNAEKWCIDCGDHIQNDWINACNEDQS